MRREMRVMVGAVAVTALSVAVLAGVRGDRVSKGGAISLHLASSSPQAGFRQVTTDMGRRLYVSPRATWTSLDVLSVDTLPGRSGETLSLRLSGIATSRLSEQLDRARDTQVAIYSGKSLIAVADVNQDGTLRMDGLSPEAIQQVRRATGSEPVAPAGPLVTVVPAGQLNGEHLVDVYVEGVDALRAYQVRVITGGGESGELRLQRVTIDENRDDFVFFGSQTIEANNPLAHQLAAVRYDGPTPANEPRYLGTYAFAPTAGASGVFRVNVELGADSVLVVGQNEEIRFNVGADARVFVGTDKVRPDSK